MKKTKLVFLSAMLVVLSGCTSTETNQDGPEMMAAHQCSDQILIASKNKKGTTKFTSILKDESTYVRVGDSSQESHHIQGFPYVESTFLDKGQPGSAWRNCMQVKGFTINQ
ncbi:hypothetical protein C6560_17645 [Enterobacter sp. FS01]|nr:hypothetical protein C6560_17645 [Enterobacter sp. FS01]